MTLRPATPDDAGAIARLHIRVWRETVGHLAPPEALRLLSEEDRRLTQWQDILTNPRPDQAVLVVEREEALIAMGAAAAPSLPVFEGRGEIKTVYVDQQFQRQGLGRRLMGTLARHLIDCAYTGAALSVVEGNDTALEFYKALGGRIAGHFTDPGPIWRSSNVLVAWDDLATLGR